MFSEHTKQALNDFVRILLERMEERHNKKGCPKCEDEKLEHEMTLTVGDAEEDEDLEYYICQNCETRIVNP